MLIFNKLGKMLGLEREEAKCKTHKKIEGVKCI